MAAAVDTAAWKCESCPYPKGTSGTVEAGAGAVSDASAKFGDFTGLQRQGAHLVLGGSLVHRSEGGYFANLDAGDLGLPSRTLSGQVGREGLYTLWLGHSELARHFADGAVTPFRASGGSVLTLPTSFAADTTAAMPLASTLQPVDLGYQWTSLNVKGSVPSPSDCMSPPTGPLGPSVTSR